MPMRILLLTPFPPNPEAGHAGGVVLWRMIQDLAQRHQLDLICFVQNKEEQRAIETLAGHCTVVQTVLHSDSSVSSDFSLRPLQRARSLFLSQLPYNVWRLRSRPMFKAVKNAVEANHYDIVQVEFTPMGQYVDALAGHPRTVFREHDLAFVHFQRRVSTESKPWRRLYHYEQWRRMVRYELDVCRQFHKIIVPSPQAKSQLLAQAPNLDVEAVSFGVTLPETLAPAKTLETRRVLFVGAMGRPLNVESVLYFYRQIWPLIRADEPSVEFWIAGSQPPEHIRQLAQTDSSVRVTGFVDDLISIYSQASVIVVPLLVGGGVVTKILDALALAKPVVTTSAANEGIGALSGQDLIVADEPDEFAKWVVDLLRDPALRARLGQSGRRMVKERFSWPRIIDQLEQIYAQLLNGT